MSSCSNQSARPITSMRSIAGPRRHRPGNPPQLLHRHFRRVGSGKTTLLNLIGCIDQPSRGEVIVPARRCRNCPTTRYRISVPATSASFSRTSICSGADVEETWIPAAAHAHAARAQTARRGLLEAVALSDKARNLRVSSPEDSASASPSPALAPAPKLCWPTSRPQTGQPHWRGDLG